MFNQIKTHPEKILPALLFISTLLRILASIVLGNQVEALPGTFDQVSYHALALRVIGGFGFTFDKNWWPMTAANSPTAHWSFLYTGYLAGIYSIMASPLLARLIQALIVGLLHPYLAYLIGKKIFNPVVGILSAAVTAFYSYFIYYAGALMTEPFYITAILGGLYLTLLLVDAEDGKQITALSVGLGLTLGITVLFRQLFLLFIPFLLLWLWWARLKKKFLSNLWISFLSAGIVVLMVLPVTAYNYARFQRFVLLNTNAGFAFFLANHPFYGTDFIPAREMQDYQALGPAELQSLDEAALDQALLKLGLGFVQDDPVRYLLLSLDRVPEYFRFWPSPDSGMISNLARVSSFGLALPWMVLGIWLWVRLHKKDPFGEFLRSPGTLLLLFSLVYTGIHVLSWALVRYRLPVDRPHE